MRLRPVLLTCLLGLASACASPPPVDDEPRVAPRAEMTVVVWSEHLQQPIRATGRVVHLGDRSARDLDTRTAPGAGHTLTGLEPGRYQVLIELRYADEGIQSVSGRAVQYCEPGTRNTVTVVAIDRDEDDLGHTEAGSTPGSRDLTGARNGNR